MAVDKRKSRSPDGSLALAAGGGTLDVTRNKKRSRIQFPPGVTIRSVIASNGATLSIELEFWGELRAELGVDTAPLHLTADALLALGTGLPALCALLHSHGVTSPGIAKRARG